MADRRILLMLIGLVGISVFYLLWNLRGPVDFILKLRAEKLAVLVMVGAAAGASTVVFQTVASNRLLTPGIVGFDALFVFLQTGLVLIVGGVGMSGLPVMEQFLLETGLLTVFAVGLFGLLLRKGASDLIRMILTGVIIGTLLRALAGFTQRLLDPSEFAVLQQASVASFNVIDDELIPLAGVMLVAVLVLSLRFTGQLDVAALGRDKARTLGLPYDRFVLRALTIVAVMVAVSTALVGPVVFLGLLAASLANALVPDHRHSVLIPAASLIGAVVLVAGQVVFERLLGFQSTLAVVVEFAGGLLFFALVLRKPT